MEYRGKRLTVTVFGQSHAAAVGMVMQGVPAGFRVDGDALQRFLSRRAPGRADYATARREADVPVFLSGLVDGVTCGAPISARIANTNAHSQDYALFRDVPRPSHADYPALARYGEACDIRGGGPFSARLTAPLCVAGGIALQWLQARGVAVAAHIAAVGSVADDRFDPVAVTREDFDRLHGRAFPVLNEAAGEAMRALICQVKEARDSVGGIVECAALGLPVGLGGPLFEGLESSLGAALFAIPAARGVEFGSGFGAAALRGSEHNDPYIIRDGRVRTGTNHAGGILGGMTTGMPLIVRVALKPTPSIGRPQKSVRLSCMEETELVITGRHDPCVVPRAVPVAEAVTALVLMDYMLDEKRT